MSWDEVFEIRLEQCAEHLRQGAKEYLLDGGTSNKSIVEQTFEIMSRMDLTAGVNYILTPDKTTLFIRLTQIYDDYTKYRKDHAIIGEVLTYNQFRKQLTHSDIMLQNNVQKKFGNTNARCFAIDYQLLLEHGCEVEGFEQGDVPPLE